MSNHPLQKIIAELDDTIKNAEDELEKLKNSRLEYYKILFSDIFNIDIKNILNQQTLICMIYELKYSIDKNRNKISFNSTGKTMSYNQMGKIDITDRCSIYGDLKYDIPYFKNTYLINESKKYTHKDYYILFSNKFIWFIIDKIQYDKFLNDIE